MIEARCGPESPTTFTTWLQCLWRSSFLPWFFFSLNDDLYLACSEVCALICAYVWMHRLQRASPILIPHPSFDREDHSIFGSCEIKISKISKCFFTLRYAGCDFWLCALSCEATVFIMEGLRVEVQGHPWLLGKFAVCPGYMTPGLKWARSCPQSYPIVKVVFIVITTSCLHHKVICSVLLGAENSVRQEEYTAARAQPGMEHCIFQGV